MLTQQLEMATLLHPTSLTLSPLPTQSPHCNFPSANRGMISTCIRMMGGGPRTYPGGVKKWQWKRMQEKKEKQIRKARLLRERQVYEMRRRAELLAATPQLEKPWEKNSRFGSVNRVMGDEQIKTLARTLEERGREDLWNKRDGPVTFVRPDGEPSIGFIPQNAAHRTKMYGRVESTETANLREGQKSKASGSSGYNCKVEFWRLGCTEAKESMSENFPSRDSRRNIVDRNDEPSSEGHFRLDLSGRRRPRNANFK